MYERSIQGGVLADGLNCFWSALATTLPCTTYAQNNGVISLTRCGARRAGWACGAILILLGVIAKFAGIILTIPDCVLGGMTTFLFINVAISGMRILTMGEGITRRNRFISAMALSIGIGVELVPAFINITGQSEYPFEGNFWPIKQSWSAGYRGFRDALIIVLSTGFSIGGFIALFMNLILPHDLDDVDSEKGAAHDTAYSTGTADREKDGMLFDKPHEQEMVA
jgi:xanthine/uracil permease